MGTQERECWEQFCRTGLVSDYLEYRAAVDYRRPAPMEGSIDADRHQSGGALGPEHGGA